MKLASTNRHNIDSTCHEKAENDLAMIVKENTHAEEDAIKIHMHSKRLNNSKSEAGTAGSKIKFLWSIDPKKAKCLIQGTVCKKLSNSYTSWKETRSRSMVTVK